MQGVLFTAATLADSNGFTNVARMIDIVGMVQTLVVLCGSLVYMLGIGGRKQKNKKSYLEGLADIQEEREGGES